jgi:hypothetical protein
MSHVAKTIDCWIDLSFRPACTSLLTSSSRSQKVGSVVRSMTALTSLWAKQESSSVSSLRPTLPAPPGVGSGLRVQALSMNSRLSNLPQSAFTAADVATLYLHRGAFETALADEDKEQDPDRWCSHAACGQEAWCIVSQWVWNLRLKLGHQLALEPLRTTEFAAAHLTTGDQQTLSPAPAQGYGPATEALRRTAGRFSGRDFVPQPDGTLRCPAGQSLRVHERRREAGGNLRVVYAASVRSCRPCPLRERCQWQGSATKKPRQVSQVLHPLAVGTAPLLWRDWSRRQARRACLHLHSNAWKSR